MKNSKEHWLRWEPRENLSSKYIITNLKDDYYGLSGRLIDQHYEKHDLFFHFTGLVRAYRVTKESHKNVFLGEVIASHGSDFFENWSFFLAEETPYDSWIVEQSCTMSTFEELKHMVIVGSNYVLDVITTSNIVLTEIEINK